MVPKPPMVTIEGICGCGMLSAELAKAGFSALGVDSRFNKDTPICKTLTLALASPHGQETFARVCSDRRVVYVHLAPPCGTASKVREIRRRIGPDPKPLGSSAHPNGLPQLAGLDLVKVQAANALYDISARICHELSERNIAWSIENPSGSYMWETTPFVALRANLQTKGKLKEVQFHACMHGGRRDKRTTWWYADCNLSSLAATCDKSHAHLPWGTQSNGSHMTFATAEERRYPKLLCERVAQIIKEQFQPQQVAKQSVTERIAGQRQPRRNGSELVSETNPYHSLPVVILCSNFKVRSTQAQRHLTQSRWFWGMRKESGKNAGPQNGGLQRDGLRTSL